MKKRIAVMLTVFILALQTVTVAFASGGEITMENGNIIVDGICYSSDMKTIVSCTELFTGESFTVPNGVTAIGDNAFYGSLIKEIVIADSVEKVGNGAFYKSSVESVTFGKNSKTLKIGENAFENCAELRVITLPENVEAADDAFLGCSKLNIINLWQAGEHDSLSLSPGDIDLDDRITAGDARLALRISASLEEAGRFGVLLGDIDRSGAVTARDARRILRISAGLSN